MPVSSPPSHAFTCPPPLQPTAWTARPVLVGNRAQATVVEVSAEGLVLAPRDGGWVRAAASEPAPIVVTVPFGGVHELPGGAVPGPDGTVVVKWAEPPAELLTDLARYLLLTRDDVTPGGLKAAGLPARSAVPAVAFSEQWGEDGVEDALALRLAAHQHDGHMLGLTIDDLRSPFDAYSWHVLARHHGRLVLCSRLIMIDGDPARSQYVSWSGHEVPDHLWTDGFVEIGAGAIDPAYQAAGLYVPMMQELTRIAARVGTTHLLGGVPVDHLPRYEAMGYDLLETREVEPRPGWRFPAVLVSLDLRALVAGHREGRLVPAMRDAALVGFAQA